MDVVARFSFVLALVAVLAGAAVAGLRFLDPTLAILAVLALAGVLLAVWVILRRAKTPPNPEKRLKKSLSAGRPVLVHFYSDLSLTSMFQKPGVDRLEKRYKGRVDFLHMSLLDPAALALADRLESGLGGFILYDAAGKEVSRGRPSPLDLARLLEQRQAPHR